MIFACAHPALSETEQIMLSLKLLIGLNINEIAAAMLKNYEGVKKAITRAKKKFKNEVGRLEVPPENELNSRLEVVLKVLYLVFNEGYKSTGGVKLIKKDICAEAIRLAFILYEHQHCGTTELKALIALMYFKSARFDARINDAGELVTMEFQDRDLWNREHIAIGLKYLNESAYGKHVSRYHIEAGIESEYMISESYEKINWRQILALYNMLLNIQANPVVKLNRIVVLEKVKGTKSAMSELALLETRKDMVDNYLLYAIKGDLLLKSGDSDGAHSAFTRAMQLTDNEIEKKFLNNKLNQITKT
jgi:RNA polymerase sigma-70 factor (ECF subfamily)